MDTVPGNRVQEPGKAAAQSTISRFACRIICARDEPDHVARVYAAGFDSSRNIFLGEKATKWETEHQVQIVVHQTEHKVRIAVDRTEHQVQIMVDQTEHQLPSKWHWSVASRICWTTRVSFMRSLHAQLTNIEGSCKLLFIYNMYYGPLLSNY